MRCTNFFLKKGLKTKLFPKNIDVNFSRKISFTSVLANIKNWDPNLKFFLTGNIVSSFNTINRNRLKNIFLKNIGDIIFWNEIEKMINCNLVDISGNSVYLKSNFLSNNPLSYWLLEMYLSEFDIFLSNIAGNFGSRLNIYFLKELFSDKYFFSEFTPLKLENKLIKYQSLKLNFIIQYSYIFEKLLGKFMKCEVSLNRILYSARYLNFFSLGIIGSKNFSLTLRRKIISFVKTNLFFSIKNFKLFCLPEEYALFIGFHICTQNYITKFNSLNSRINTVKKYQRKIISRLTFFTLKMASVTNNRIRIELFTNLVKAITFKKKISSSLVDMKIWTFIFQLEALKCIQYGKIILSEDQASSFCNEFFSAVKISELKNYRSYYISLYSKRIKLVLKTILETFPHFIGKSVLPVDIGVNLFFEEFNKKFALFYDNSSIDGLNNCFLLDNEVLSFDFPKNNTSSLSRNTNSVCKLIKINVPIRYIFEKLRLLGFIHPLKKRPISNSQYLSFNDIYILKSFGYLANSLLFWFRLWCDMFILCLRLIGILVIHMYNRTRFLLEFLINRIIPIYFNILELTNGRMKASKLYSYSFKFNLRSIQIHNYGRPLYYI